MADLSTSARIVEDNFDNIELAAKDKDIVQRLEMALIHWTRQIKEACLCLVLVYRTVRIGLPTPTNRLRTIL